MTELNLAEKLYSMLSSITYTKVNGSYREIPTYTELEREEQLLKAYDILSIDMTEEKALLIERILNLRDTEYEVKTFINPIGESESYLKENYVSVVKDEMRDKFKQLLQSYRINVIG